MMFRHHGWRWGLGTVLLAVLCGCSSGQGASGATPGNQAQPAATVTPAGPAGSSQNTAGSRTAAGAPARSAANAAGGGSAAVGNQAGVGAAGSGPGAETGSGTGVARNLQVSHVTAAFDGLVATHVQAVVTGPVTAVRVYNESTHTLLGTFAPKDGKVDLTLIGAKTGNVLTLTPVSGTETGQAVRVTVQ
ncbi:MAG: hypothetical protein K6T26_01685 [Alicyclobacillus sp.]|nr:hypothetical protein [Alicyclobacillus sp.]